MVSLSLLCVRARNVMACANLKARRFSKSCGEEDFSNGCSLEISYVSRFFTLKNGIQMDTHFNE